MVVSPIETKAIVCKNKGIWNKEGLVEANILKKLDPTITHTMKTANISPRYWEVVTGVEIKSSSGRFSAGVHMKTNVYMAPIIYIK
jgi:hypothetical protein